MSPRRADPQVRVALFEAAARLLAEEGPTALTMRRLATEVGASTTAVYTHFGSKEEVVRAVVAEGFDRLDLRLRELRPSGDPVTDLANMGWAYRRNALANPHLYAAMFGRTMFAYDPHPTDRATGLHTLAHLVDGVAVAAKAGRMVIDEAWPVASELWMMLHGVVSLEINGFFETDLFDGIDSIRRLFRDVTVGHGDDPAAAEASIAASTP